MAALAPNDPEELTIHTPVLILQGTADGTVLPLFTDQLDTALRGHGGKVTYKKYEGISHGAIVHAGDTDALAFAKARLR